jgi:threonine dehydratase
MTPADVTLADIVAAQRRLRGHLSASPERDSFWLSRHTGASVTLKIESVQVTNSFKIRGALNAMLRLADNNRHATVVTASAGNHGRAIAFAGERLGIKTVVFTPVTAPRTKKLAISHHGAELRDEAPNYDEAERRAREYAQRTQAVYISPYNHPDVIAGAGTVALELLQSLAFDSIIVPIGGGGLASGIAIAAKSASRSIRVIGVEVDASRPFAASLARGAITEVDVKPSLADGLIGNLEPGAVTFDYVRRFVDEVTSVSEDDLQAAIRGLATEEHLIVEGAGAAATAAVLSQRLARGTRAVVLVTGSNVDGTKN